MTKPPPRKETVWVDVFGKWMPTGHVDGTSVAERERERYAKMAATHDKRALAADKRIVAMLEREWDDDKQRWFENPAVKKTVAYKKLTRKYRDENRKYKAAEIARRKWTGIASGEKAQRRAEFLQKITGTQEYIEADYRACDVQSRIRRIEDATKLDDAMRAEIDLRMEREPKKPVEEVVVGPWPSPPSPVVVVERASPVVEPVVPQASWWARLWPW